MFDRLRTEVAECIKKNHPSKQDFYDVVLGMEYSFAECKEATFQVKLISEQVGIDLKKSIR